jgi:sec-independent protein translocase protein TatA
MFSGLQNPTHIMILAVLLIVLFGAKRLPEIGRSLGTGMREFKDSVTNAAPLELVSEDQSQIVADDKESVISTARR